MTLCFNNIFWSSTQGQQLRTDVAVHLDAGRKAHAGECRDERLQPRPDHQERASGGPGQLRVSREARQQGQGQQNDRAQAGG